ncbi:cupin domain-containing protein [Vibrio sp. S4M6]|uniref:cupin domain-containing protein n=1 Tax=Vibrio sinus TaxID=2946865 RepID=UPI00202A4FBA|nr:cupin domain-containing protein [Vibrio sinus]MCL9780194.1 cupin domain-containing protein [Vibrio sinus]
MKKLLVGIVFSLLVTTANAASSVDLNKSTKSWNGNDLPSISLTSPEVTIKEIIVEPGEKLPVHLHPVINAGILLSGKLTVYTENKDKVLHLEAGTPNNTIIEMVDTYHYGINEGKIPAKIVVFYVAEKDAAVTELKHDH